MSAGRDRDVITSLESELECLIPEVADIGLLFSNPGGFISRNNRIVALGIVGEAFLEVPSVIGDLSALEILVLGEDGIDDLPLPPGCLPSLRELYIWGNSFTAFPSFLLSLNGLEKFDGSENYLEELLPEIGYLTTLRELDLSQNHLHFISPKLGELVELEYLNLWTNHLAALPPEIGNIEAIRSLDLGHNEFSVFPEGVAYLTHLRELYLGYNQLTSLPPVIGSMSSLEVLHLGGNPLTSLPGELLEMPCLADVEIPASLADDPIRCDLGKKSGVVVSFV
ncbi:MAG TPA: leucine-rich repeat domain-containing protein [Candidatus Lokiarchaeia archaeon]|nr:leucine-rich repeat domain-containing protein [Candidatus Lokiarchaeia archaeon]